MCVRARIRVCTWVLCQTPRFIFALPPLRVPLSRMCVACACARAFVCLPRPSIPCTPALLCNGQKVYDPKPQTLITKYSQLAAQALCMQPEIGLKDLRLTGALHKHCVSSAVHETKRLSAESAALPSCTRV